MVTGLKPYLDPICGHHQGQRSSHRPNRPDVVMVYRWIGVDVY